MARSTEPKKFVLSATPLAVADEPIERWPASHMIYQEWLQVTRRGISPPHDPPLFGLAASVPHWTSGEAIARAVEPSGATHAYVFEPALAALEANGYGRIPPDDDQMVALAFDRPRWFMALETVVACAYSLYCRDLLTPIKQTAVGGQGVAIISALVTSDDLRRTRDVAGSIEIARVSVPLGAMQLDWARPLRKMKLERFPLRGFAPDLGLPRPHFVLTPP